MKLSSRTIFVLVVVGLLFLGLSRSFSARAVVLEIPETEATGPQLYLLVASFDPLADPSLSSSAAVAVDGYYLVQFEGPITPADREALSSAGVRIFDYVPDFAFLVKMEDTVRDAVAALPQVRWVGAYRPEYRIAPELAEIAAQPAIETLSTRQAPFSATVVVFGGEELAPIVAQIEALGGTVTDRSPGERNSKLHVTISPHLLDALAAIPGVYWVERAPQWQLYNDEAVDVMGVREVWNTHGLRGAGQVVGVCDSGLDQGSASPGALHDDFEDGSGSSRVTAIYDLAGDGTNDVNSGHGTHVAGSVLGNGAMSGANPATHIYPDTAYVGVAPEAQLVFQATESNVSKDLILPGDLAVLFEQAAAHDVKIHTNSWGSDDSGAYSSYSQDVDEYVWNHKDFTILFAAGNAGIDTNTDGVVDPGSIGSPATAKNAISVGATENNRPSLSSIWGSGNFPVDPIYSDRLADDVNGMAAFSGRGPTDDGRTKPDIVAPGTYIISTRSADIDSESNGWGSVDANYMYMGGTSMATPLVAGASTLIREYYTNEGISPSAALIKATLVNGAVDIYPGQYGTGTGQELATTRPTHVAGWGRVNLENSLFPTAPRNVAYVDEANGLTTGQTRVYSYYVTGSSEPLHFTLAWSDAPGSLASGGRLVNDLDLKVVDPTNTVHYATTSGPDRLNNLVGVDISTPILGVYRVEIEGYNVPESIQTYALVASGALTDVDPLAPTVTSITPNSGPNTTTVQIDSLLGTQFHPSATVALERTGYPARSALSVTVVSSNVITCTLDLNDLALGKWGVVVTNPDGMSGRLSQGFTVFTNDTFDVYLPLIMKIWPPIPGSVTLNAINNPYSLNHYQVTWGTAARAESYELQEDDNPNFSSPETRYSGTMLSWSTTGKAVSNYYYRVRAINGWGNGPWSAVKATGVTPGPEPGYWFPSVSSVGLVAFDVVSNKREIRNFTAYIMVNSEDCPDIYSVPYDGVIGISNNQFSFSGSFYASGTFNSTMTASGRFGLNRHYVEGCGLVSGELSWNSALDTPLTNASGFTIQAELVESDSETAERFSPPRALDRVD